MKSYIGKLNRVFVSRTNYPNTDVSLLLRNPDTSIAKSLFVPRNYRTSSFDIKSIVQDRKELTNSFFKSKIFDRSRRINDVHDMLMSKKPIDLEVDFKKDLNQKGIIFDKSNIDMPVSKYNDINKFKITSNISYIKPLQNIYYDKDITLIDSFKELNNRVDIYKLIDLFSSGAFGKTLNKKLVPTRWSITASDDILSKQNIEQIRKQSLINKYELYYSYYLGNHYLTLLLPFNWSYELFEFGVNGYIDNDFNMFDLNKPRFLLGNTSTDYESFFGRKKYAVNCTGGYYAARYSVTKYLLDRKKQASVIQFRFVDNNYYKPLGVWVCREASAFDNSKCIGFYDDFDVAKKAALDFSRKLGIINLEKFTKTSLLLKNFRSQRRLNEYA